MKITSPTLLVNEEICRNNIMTMADKAKRNSCEFIPHFKTHQSREIGKWFNDYGVEKITVSSVQMAEYFAEAGWDDIYIAFPVNILELERINTLASDINLTLLVSNETIVTHLAERLKYKVSVRIEIDTGAQRTGILSANFEIIEKVINAIKKSNKIDLIGFYSHAGHTYAARNIKEIETMFIDAKLQLFELKEKFGLPVSFGDTPCCSVIDVFDGFSSIHPGNFVFYDVMQTIIGSCTEKQIGVGLACPVVDIKPERSEVVVHGGAVHLSKEEHDGMFGKIASLTDSGWDKPYDECFVKGLSQEHGVLQVTSDVLHKIKVGDIIVILPIHSCLTADCMGEYVTLCEQTLDHFKKIHL